MLTTQVSTQFKCLFLKFFFVFGLIIFDTRFLHKVFVANPKKPREVTKILVNNKAKLIAYLENFHNDRVRFWCMLMKC